MTAYLRPTDDAHAIALRAAHADYLVLAGGTDLLVAAHHKPVPVGILDIAGRFAGISVDADAARIGAGTTWRAIATSAELAATWPILPAAAREVGALQIQTRGTIGRCCSRSTRRSTWRRCAARARCRTARSAPATAPPPSAPTS